MYIHFLYYRVIQCTLKSETESEEGCTITVHTGREEAQLIIYNMILKFQYDSLLTFSVAMVTVQDVICTHFEIQKCTLYTCVTQLGDMDAVQSET